MKDEKFMERSNQRLLSALGLCRKAGKLICGTPLICDALRSAKKPCAVIMASDNSENTQKKLSDKCAFYGVPLFRIAADTERLMLLVTQLVARFSRLTISLSTAIFATSKLDACAPIKYSTSAIFALLL